MNEFSAKKMGEVLAFAQVGVETVERAQSALSSVIGETVVNMMRNVQREYDTKLQAIATAEGVAEIVLTKAGKTGDKLRQMRDLYIGDEWDNATEVMEWLGFFTGAAIVHWELVAGVAKALGHEDLQKLAENAVSAYQKALEVDGNTLQQVGSARASQ
jgi:hypothetical protein